MLLDLSQPRKEYFKRWTAHQILVQFLEKKRFLPRDLLEVEKSAVMTMEGNLEALVDGESYNKDHFEMVDKVNSADRDTLLVFPPSYRVPAGDSRSIIAYRYNSLVPLHPFRNQQKKASEVVKDAFDKLHEERDQFMSRELIGYSWLGEDGLLRVVPFMNDIKGQELRAFQNLAWYQLEFPELEERVLDELSAGELKDDSRMVQKVKKYHAHLGSQRREGDTLQHYVNQLEVRLRDTIRISLIEQQRVMNFQVPSRRNIYKEHNVKICNIPLQGAGDSDQQVWRMYGECDCSDSNYRSDRRDWRKEFYFCAHEIASLQTFKAVLEQRDERERIHSLPFPIPNRRLIDFIDKLRYRAVILDYNPETEKTRVLPLNDTEIGVIAMKKMVAEGYERNATADLHAFRRQKYDPILDLVKFKVAGI